MNFSDPFVMFRTALFIALAAYYVISTVTMITRGVVLLAGTDPRKRLLRTYLSYLLVTIRLRPLAGELLQIAVWTAVLLLLYGMHVWL
jgi:hypothetical protein